MPRLIDADALISDLNEYVRNVYGANSIDTDDVADFQRASNSQSEIFTVEGIYESTKIIDKQATIDAEPVRHGEWLFGKHHGYYMEATCSACEGILLVKWYTEIGKYTYCPNCGAKMDGGEKEE